MEYRKHYTDAELDELVGWFEKNMERLPASLRMSESTLIADFPHTVRLYFDIVRQHKDNPTYSGQIYQLFKMRDAVRAEVEG